MNVAHFIWFQGPPPSKYLTTIDTFKIKNPTFKVYIWSESTLLPLLTGNSIFKNGIDKCQYMIQKIDIYKFVILYYYGGIYLDLDIKTETPFSNSFLTEIKKHDLVFSKIKLIPYLPIDHLNNGIIFAKRGSPLLLKIVDDINWDQPFYKTKDWRVLDTAGPMYINRWCNQNNIKTIDQKYVEGRPLFLYNNNDRGLFITHLHHNNWMESYLYLIVILINYSVYLFILIIILYLLMKGVRYI